jgi:hypothetical protein
VVQLRPAPDCEALGRPTSLTFLYSGGGCGAGNNPQSGRATCSGVIDPSLPVTIASANGYTITPTTVAPGGTFTVSAGSFASQSTFTLRNAGGTETVSIHTSCSQVLAVGNIFGSLTLVGFNGQTAGTDVIYRYTVSNTGAQPLADVVVSDDQLGEIAGPITLAAGESRNFDRLVHVTRTVTNVATAQVRGRDCRASSGPVVVTVRPEGAGALCNLTPGTLKIDKKQLQLPLRNNGSEDIFLSELMAGWPESVNGLLKKVKLNGDVWAGSTGTPATLATAEFDEFNRDTNRRKIKPGESKTLVLEFERNAAKDARLYSGLVRFGTDDSCVHRFGQVGGPAGGVPQLFIESDEAGGCHVVFTGTPGVTYHLQRAPAPSGPWTTIAERTVPLSGMVECHDINPLPGQSFYRAVRP